MAEDPVERLTALAGGMDAAFAGGVQTQLQWLEDTAQALDAADLGDEGKAAALNLRAALGAVVHWARGPRDEKTLPELEGVVRTFTTRGVVALHRALAAGMRALADARAPQRAVCLDLASIFDALATAQENGAPPPVDVLERLTAARAAFAPQTTSTSSE